MSLTIEQKSGQSYKKHKGVADTNSAKTFYEEGVGSPITVLAQNVYQQGADIPVIAPSHLVNEETEGVITRYIDLALIPVPGSPDSFYHDNLKDCIPFNFGDGSYNYMTEVKDSLNNILPPGLNDFEIDPIAGVLRFYSSAPLNMPPKISFYRYTGIKGVGSVDIQDYRIVLDIVARDAIPFEERKNGTLCYVQAGDATYQLQGGIDNSDWALFSVGAAAPTIINMANNTSGQQVLVEFAELPSFKIYYRTDRGVLFESGTIQVDYKDASVIFTESGGLMPGLGITIDFNIIGDDVVLDWIIDDNVDGAVMSFVIGSLVSGGTGSGGDMYKVVYDPNNVNSDAFDMENMVEGINNKILSSVERNKLSGIETGAEVNPVDTDELTEGSTNEYYTDTKVSANADVTANTIARHSHANKAVIDIITDAGSGSIISIAERNKLVGIATGAEVNQSDVQIKAQYEANPDTNAFTNAEKGKLSGLDENKFLGTYTSLGDLQTAHPSPSPGSYGDVDQAGADVIRYIWDITDNKYVAQLGESTAETAASIKVKYESNPDTNAYTDAEKSKLVGIETGAEVNPVDTDELTEGSTNEYYTDTKVSANADVTANTAGRHSHTNKTILDAISNEGSGAIITNTERSKLGGIEIGAQVNPVDTDAVSEGTLNLYYTEIRVSANTDVVANTIARHSHMNKTILDSITDEGSGSIITTAERNKLTGLSEDPIPTNTDELTEGTSNLYYTEIRVSANTDVQQNTIDRHVHGNKTNLDNITDEGSGSIITTVERNKLSGIEEGAQVQPFNTDELAEGPGSLYYTEVRVSENTDVIANTTDRHSHINKAALDDIIDSGSGVIISTAERNKLIDIEDGAEVNQTDAEIKVQYEINVNTNAFTDGEKSKLAALESSKYLGQYVSLVALETTHPSPSPGSYGDVDAGVGQDVIRYIWDNDDTKYVAQLGESNVESAASVKAKYESNSDTNVFTDAEQTKLGGIETGAEVNPVDTDELTEGPGSLYYTEVRVSANTDVVANTSDRHSHINKTILDAISDAGSGLIITTAERNKLSGIETGAEVNPVDTDELTEGTSNLYYTEVRVSANTDVAANTSDRHSHTNKAVLDVITNAGSGLIITTAERNKLGGIETGAEVNQTDAEIKVQYENNANTNEFNDAEKVKLAKVPAAAAFMYIISSSTSTTLTQNIWTKIAGTYATYFLDRFTHLTGRLTYTALNNFQGVINIALSVTSLAERDLEVRVFKNGVIHSTTALNIFMSKIDKRIASSFMVPIDLVQNDYIEVFIRNTESSDAGTVENLQLHIKGRMI